MAKSSYPDIIMKRFNTASDDVQWYFQQLPKLLQHFHLDICIGYLFSNIEMAQNWTLYCGIVKLHNGEKTLTWEAIENQYITRDKFREFFKVIFGKEIDSTLVNKVKDAEKIRDKIMHGKTSDNKERKQAIFDIIEYSEKFNAFVQNIAGFKPFGNLTGFKGRGKPLSKSTTRWILKGMGFGIQ
ncbi:MAG: hypothetical protein A2220_11085 [Ignavibacteria bacterium RIFOXYA2_FULL_35_10]|nr:MAG: hypothetical protein A2220_11085 [Ignavibacteria bacterium RIFOXYA2_FULL_35_10]